MASLFLTLCFLTVSANGLEKYSAKDIPKAERIPNQPKELVAVFGSLRQRHWDEVTCLAFSPDSKLLATGGKDHVVRLWQSATMKPLGILRHPWATVTCLAFSQDGKTLLSGDTEGNVLAWQLAPLKSDKPIYRLEQHSAILSIHFFRNDQALCIASKESPAWLWKREGKRWRVISDKITHNRLPYGLRAIPKAKNQFVAVNKSTLQIWDAKNLRKPKIVHTIEESLDKHSQLEWTAVSPDGTHLANNVKGKLIVRRRISQTAFAQPRRVESALTQFRAAAFSPDNHWLALSGIPKTIIPRFAVGSLKIYDLEQERIRFVAKLTGHVYPVTAVVFSPDGKWLASASRDGTVRSWQVKKGEWKEIRPLQGHQAPLTTLAFSPTQDLLITGSRDRTVHVRSLAKKSTTWHSKEQPGAISALSISVKGKWLAVGCEHSFRDGRPQLRVWDLSSTPPKLHATSGTNSRVPRTLSLAFCPITGRLFSGHEHFFQAPKSMLWKVAEKNIQLLNANAERPKFRVLSIRGAAFSSNGGRLVTTLGSNIETFPSVSKPKVLNKPLHSVKVNVKELVWPEPPPPLRDLARSAKSDYVAVACSDYHVRVYSWTKKNDVKHLRTLKGHQRAVTSVAFSPAENHALVSADEAGKVILWDVKTGKRIKQWQFPGIVHDLAFARDGKHFATANGNGTCYLLRLTAWLNKVSNP